MSLNSEKYHYVRETKRTFRSTEENTGREEGNQAGSVNESNVATNAETSPMMRSQERKQVEYFPYRRGNEQNSP